MKALLAFFRRRSHQRALVAIAMSIPGFYSALVHAQVPDVTKTKRDAEQLKVAIGLGVVKLPQTLGGKIFPVPYVDLNYKDFFAFNFDTASLYWRKEAWELGATAGFAFGRQENDLAAFRGLGNVRNTLAGGVYLTRYWGETAQVSMSYSRDMLNRGQGGQLRIEGVYGVRLSPRWLVSAGPSIGWADQEHMQTFYGVTADQAAASGRERYSPSGGLESVGVSLNTYYGISKRWSFGGSIGLDRLLGDAKNSPVTRAIGGATNVSAFIGLTYQWQ